MRGIMLIVKTTGEMKTTEYSGKTIPLKELNDAVGGYLEAVPLFNKIKFEGKMHRCVVFCNEEGKLNNLPFNQYAQLMWSMSLGVKWNEIGDYLCGDVAIVFGDDEFMQEL